jgi:hypothetical protein
MNLGSWVQWACPRDAAWVLLEAASSANPRISSRPARAGTLGARCRCSYNLRTLKFRCCRHELPAAPNQFFRHVLELSRSRLEATKLKPLNPSCCCCCCKQNLNAFRKTDLIIAIDQDPTSFWCFLHEIRRITATTKSPHPSPSTTTSRKLLTPSPKQQLNPPFPFLIAPARGPWLSSMLQHLDLSAATTRTTLTTKPSSSLISA